MTQVSAATSTRRRKSLHPARLVVLSFSGAILAGAGLLALPIATETRTSAGIITPLFTSTSAICVTGLAVVDTPTYWSTFGEVVIMALMQLGGFGIMTLSSLIGIFLSRRLGLRQRLRTQADVGEVDLGDIRTVVVGVAAFSAVIEGVAFLGLSARLMMLGESFGRSLYVGAFHAVSAFNNAGFSLNSDSLIGHRYDWWTLGIVGWSIVLGGLGFPVLLELKKNHSFPKRWSLHTKITLFATAGLIVIGLVLLLICEWTNGDTFGPMSVPGKVLNAWFSSVTPRTAGFNTVDYGAMRPNALLVTDALMLIGGGSASTAGGIKVTTFAVLGYAVWAEVRGTPDTHAFRRRITSAAQRQALAVALLSIGFVVSGTFALLTLAPLDGSDALFEAISAASTVGLSTGITPALPASGHLVLIALMFLGRVGPVTLLASIVLRERHLRYRLPHERPLLG